MFFQCGLVACNAQDLFNSHEMEEGSGQSMNPTIGVWDVLATIKAIPNLFKNLTNFTITKFQEFASLMVFTIISYVRSTCEGYFVTTRPSKLKP